MVVEASLRGRYISFIEKRIIPIIAFIATLYHIYIVFHGYLPKFPIPRLAEIFELTQLIRATHVMLVLVLGYLSFKLVKEVKLGLTSMALVVLLSAVPTCSILLSLAHKPLNFITVPLVVISYYIAFIEPVLLAIVSRFNLKIRVVKISEIGALVTLCSWLWLWCYYWSIIMRVVHPEPLDLALGWSLFTLVLGLALRRVGSVLPLILLIFVMYAMYGQYIPGIWGFGGLPIEYLLAKLYMETEAGLFGLITGVSVGYVVYFVLFGMILYRTFGDLFTSIAFSLLRGAAGVGRATVALSALLGMVSGSGVAVTSAVGSIMKPLFERAKYDRETMAGFFASCGTAALITPPVLGAVAFIIAEVLAISYLWVVVMSVIPAALYLTCILLYNELYVRKHGLQVQDLGTTKVKYRVTDLLMLMTPIALIIVLIAMAYPVNLSVTIAILLTIVFSLVSKRVRLKDLYEILWKSFIDVLTVATSLIAASTVMTVVVLTGLAPKVSMLLTQLSGGVLIVALVIVALFTILLGMGLPPTASYVLASALTAPAIIKLSTTWGIPEVAATLAAHMFVFYYAILADVTPPVALAAYAAAGIVGVDPIRAGVKAAIIALPKYLIGLLILTSYAGTGLLILPVILTAESSYTASTIIVRQVVITLYALFVLTVCNVGYLRKEVSAVERAVGLVGSMIMLFPMLVSYELSLTIGFVLTLLPLVRQFLVRRTS